MLESDYIVTLEPVKIGNALLYCGDCMDILPTLEDKSVHAVITDPPYEQEAHTNGRRLRGKQISGARTLEYGALDFDRLTNQLRDDVSKEMVRACSGWLLTFCQAEAVALWRDSHQTAGAKYKRSMVWVKPDGAPQFTGDRPGMGYESVVASWCVGGRSTWNGGGKRGVFIIPNRDSNHPKFHPTQKPIRLMNELVTLFSDEDEIVLDPFMGGGTTGVACANHDRNFIGIEKDPKYFDAACERISYAHSQGKLF